LTAFSDSGKRPTFDEIVTRVKASVIIKGYFDARDE
jgi:hypothetical protein